MTLDQLPEPTPDVLAALERSLSIRGVKWRVVDGVLRVKTPKGFTDGDREVFRHYGPAFKAWVVAGRPSVATPPELEPHACPDCGEADPARHTYQTERSGELVVVCVRCGAAWLWGEPAQPLSGRDRVFFRRTCTSGRRTA